MQSPSQTRTEMAIVERSESSTSIPNYANSSDDNEEDEVSAQEPLLLVAWPLGDWTSFRELSYYIRVVEDLAKPYAKGSGGFYF